MVQEEKMSTERNWGAEGASATIGAHASTLLRELALEHRLKALHDVALSLLTEVESLGNAPASRTDRKLKLHDEVRQFETDLIRIALDRTQGSQTRAARLLGVKLTTLNTKIKRYKIEFAGQKTERQEIRDRQNAA
jgi:transcriptional regulator with GAF, ATPase, and Fis domain